MTWTNCEWWKISPVFKYSCSRCYSRTSLSAETDERLLWKADAAVVQDTQSITANPTARERVSTVSATTVGCNTLERLVELRYSHQTRRAANSVRSRGEPKLVQNGGLTGTSAAAERQKLCVQMADVIRRSGTGLERCARWRSAPGTMDPSEVSKLSGNSANAEVVARDRVNAVSGSIARYPNPHPT